MYCFRCRDYIYDAELDQISREVEQQLAHKQYHGKRGVRERVEEGREWREEGVEGRVRGKVRGRRGRVS